jgi:ribosomal protein L7/L12
MSDAANPLPPDVLAALQCGNTIEAIKLLRASTGLGLKEAKDVIDAHFQGKPMPGIGQSTTPGTALPASVIAALQRGKKIEAIGLLREQSGLGLKEAKDAVDAYQREQSPKLAPGEVARSGKGLWLLLAVALLVLGYYLFR